MRHILIAVSIFCSSAAFATKLSLRGELVVSVADNFETKKAVTTFHVKDKTGKLTAIRLQKKDELQVKPGAMVSIEGNLSGASVEAEAITYLSFPAPIPTIKKILVVIIQMDGGNDGINTAGVESALYGSAHSARDLFRC
jgi:hypothetical protein